MNYKDHSTASMLAGVFMGPLIVLTVLLVGFVAGNLDRIVNAEEYWLKQVHLRQQTKAHYERELSLCRVDLLAARMKHSIDNNREHDIAISATAAVCESYQRLIDSTDSDIAFAQQRWGRVNSAMGLSAVWRSIEP